MMMEEEAMEIISNKPKLRTYGKFKNNVNLEEYVTGFLTGAVNRPRRFSGRLRSER